MSEAKRYAVAKHSDSKTMVANIADCIHDFPGVSINAVQSSGLVFASMPEKIAQKFREYYGFLIIPAERYHQLAAFPDANLILMEIAFAFGERIDANRVHSREATMEFLYKVGFNVVAERLTEDQKKKLDIVLSGERA